ncbi:unnamed protein product [Prorocentrum cordatum]|uniref:Uncharacterized protein n=1 Tax=Prorocentrum cordatum TaxID=2364126 RepID=A0ABN9SUC6_9DINO|nr:unnamed protein product [Polarella glacialis]
MGGPTAKASGCAPDSKAEKVGVLVSDMSVGDVLGLENTRFCKQRSQCDPETQEELRKPGALVGGAVDNSAEACAQDWFVGELSVGTQTVDQVEGEGQQQGVGSVKSDADRVEQLALEKPFWATHPLGAVRAQAETEALGAAMLAKAALQRGDIAEGLRLLEAAQAKHLESVPRRPGECSE